MANKWKKSKNQVHLPIITARPFGSIAKYWPGTIRRHPLLPKVSKWIYIKTIQIHC